jgi:hypothetical protein
MKEKLYSIKRKFTGLETDKSFRVSKLTLLNKEKRHTLPDWLEGCDLCHPRDIRDPVREFRVVLTGLLAF